MQFWIGIAHIATVIGYLVFTALSIVLFRLDYTDVPRPKKALVARVCVWIFVTIIACALHFWWIDAIWHRLSRDPDKKDFSPREWTGRHLCPKDIYINLTKQGESPTYDIPGFLPDTGGLPGLRGPMRSRILHSDPRVDGIAHGVGRFVLLHQKDDTKPRGRP